ncbi:hypothetical protein ACRS84_29140, partial [Pseudomonas aeruginosa]
VFLQTRQHLVAQKVDSWPLPANPRGHLEFFVERLVQHPATGSAV